MIKLTDLEKAQRILEKHRAAERATKLAEKRAAKKEKTLAGFVGVEAVIQADLQRVENWIHTAKVPYDPRAHAFTYMHRSRAPSMMGRIIARAMLDDTFRSSAAELAMCLYADTLREEYVAELRTQMPLVGESAPGDMLEQFLAFLLQRQPSKLDIVQFRQFIWQIKRRVHGKLTEWETMPLFTGGQGWGKTRHLKRLWASVPVLPTFVAKGQRFRIFEDDFGRAIFNQCFLIPFEEMSGASKADIETLKMFITEDEVQARIMRAEQFQVMRMNATFYGTSNMPGGASLQDSSGMRRFWEFVCPNTNYQDDVHGAQLAKINFAAIWDCVDATSDVSPARPHVKEIMEFSAKTFAKSGALHSFFGECIKDLSADSDRNIPPLMRAEAWAAFTDWKKDQSGFDKEKLTKADMDVYVQKTYGYQRLGTDSLKQRYYVGLQLIHINS